MKVLICNNGCVREETIAKNLRNKIIEAGHTKCYSIREADVIIYITCAGTSNSINESYQDINVCMRLKKEDALLIITGCLTKIDPLFEDIKKKDNIYIIKNPDFIIPVFNILNNEAKRNTVNTRLENRTRFNYDTITSIQFFLCHGCTNNCSFCKSNYLDEPLTSIPYEIAFNYLKSLVEKGCKVITLSGDNLTLYGIDLYGQQVLHKFIHELCALPGLMYLNVYEVTAQNMYPELLKELILQKKVKNVGIQLETASDALLKLMNRNHNMEKFDYIVKSLDEDGKLVTTVLMSGFPTETYDDLDFTINYLKSRNIYTDLICEYEDFALIPSSELPQLKNREKRKHSLYLKDAIVNINKDALMHKIDDTRKSIVTAKDGKKVYLRNFFFGYTIKKEYQDAELGDIVEIPAHNVVHLKKSKIGYQYKY